MLNCDRVTTNMAEEIRRIGLNFGDAEKRVHGVEAMVESHTMPKPELAKVEALELQVRLLMTRLEQSEHEVHALREEIRTRPHGGPPEGMRPDSHVLGELQRKLESLENKYQLLKHAGTPSVNPIGIPTATPKPEPRVRVFGVPAREERVAGSLPGFGFPPAEDDLSSMRSYPGFPGKSPKGSEEWDAHPRGTHLCGFCINNSPFRPQMALQVRYLALNPHPTICPSPGTMYRTSNRFYGLRLRVSATDPPGPPQEDLENVYMVRGG